MDLQRRVALVTGGATGLGAAVCRHLADAGAAVAVNYATSADAAAALAASLPKATAVRADVADERQVADMLAHVERTLGPVDLLVNNAGVTVYVPFEDLEGVSTDDWERIWRTNVLGTWSCVRAAAPNMRRRGAGAIVNVASDSALTFEGSSVPYVASKAAVVALTHTLAQGLAPSVRVNAVAPGWMDTPWLDRYVPEARRAALRDGREPIVDVDEVARVVVDLLGGDRTGAVVELTPTV
jgi:NAD(P)-dependent dehydrogenase (short-subunit alcohol dehydrogenase family)